MGGPSCLFLVILWVLVSVCVSIVLPAYGQGNGGTLCDVPGCKCTQRVKAAEWKIVNCSLDSFEDVQLTPGSIPQEIVEIFISGGQTIRLATMSFNALPGLTILYISGAQYIEIDKDSFHNLTVYSLLIRIENCDRLIIKTGAFDSAQTSVTAEIFRTSEVQLERAAFSKFLSGSFEHISALLLAEGTFEIKHQTIHEEHGPGTKISFNDTVIPKIPGLTFSSALAEVSIQNSKIGTIHPEAFKASQITAIAIVNSSIDTVMSDAFSHITLVRNFLISKCIIKRLNSRAIMAGIEKFTIEHSTITDISPLAVNIPVINIDIIGNKISTFGITSFSLKNWDKVTFEQNIILHLRSHFLEAVPSSNKAELSFLNNDIQFLEPYALDFLSKLNQQIVKLNNNFFNETCRCSVTEWMQELTNDTRYTEALVETSFCTVNELLARCYELEQGLINIQNFTSLVCNLGDKILCEKYVGETKYVNDTLNVFPEDDENSNKTSWLILIITVVGLAILSIIATFVFLLLKGGRWLKRKGYFRNIHYNQNERSNDEENTIVTIDENEPLEFPQELSLELLQQLRKRLDDPNIKDEATEMIERLYEMFIVEDNYENNNRQDEEAHLYEELGNLQQFQQTDQEPPDKLQQDDDGPMSILRLMEEKFNLQTNENETDRSSRPALAGEYSEPSDAAVHLYSELQQNRDSLESDNKNSLKSMKSTGSGKMALRPLPDKPSEDGAGPSSK